MAHSRFNPATSTVVDAQHEMRHVYFGGAPGVMTSGTVWLIAAILCIQLSPEQAIWALFIGGMFIHPVSVVFTKLLGRPGNHSSGNPMGALALATTAWLILSCPLAYAVSTIRIEWFFPAMLFIIGGRYMTFATIYGTKIYWAFGAALALAGWLLAQAGASPLFGAATGAAIEAAFALVIFAIARRESAAAVHVQSA